MEADAVCSPSLATEKPRKKVKAGKPWTPRADAIIRDAYPDYRLMRRRLPHRSLAALKNRAAVLGVVHRRHTWTNMEVRKLAALFAADASNAELEHAFPGLRLRQIKEKARHLRLPHRKPRLVSLNDPALDAVRQRAIDKGLSLRRLDRKARTGRYFQQSTTRPVLAHLARAAVILEGELRIRFDPA
ncbi:hypothetical protein JIX58_10405 [Brevundimonas diminuta]|uniref:hypothetical protein n=1 Tax=Brevundimonas TaxID=41275 RepID=UPI0019042A16|nr:MULTISPECIES: hypothetical protein [Brevundimonas]MBK1976155.1 hypothetical protein [Brevundimonas diminuta]